jgi:hypothetical protein
MFSRLLLRMVAPRLSLWNVTEILLFYHGTLCDATSGANLLCCKFFTCRAISFRNSLPFRAFLPAALAKGGGLWYIPPVDAPPECAGA